MTELIELFLLGFLSFAGPCLLFCTPVVFPYIISTREKISEKFKSFWVFILSRFFITIITGGGSAFLGLALINLFGSISKYLQMFFSLLILFSGIMVLLKKQDILKLCRFTKKPGSYMDIAILGALIAIFPCVPRLGLWAYVASQSVTVSKGILMTSSFAIGEALSPIIFAGLLTTFLPNIFSKKTQIFFYYASGLILIFAGLSLFWKILF